MKILHISKKYPPALGGDAVVVHNLEQQQIARGHEVVIATSKLADLSERRGLHSFGLPETSAGVDNITARRLGSLLMLLIESFSILRSEKPDVIHAHSVDLAFFMSFAARWRRIPMVNTFHIVTHYDENQAWLRRKSELLLAKGAGLRYVTAPNAYDVAQLQTAGITSATLLPNGVDLDYWQVEDQQTDQFTFAAVGRIEKQKGYEYLVRAAALVAEEERNFRVKIAGEGALRNKLAQLALRLGVEEQVELLGRTSVGETRSLLAQADVVVQTSLYETTPLTLLEAWAAGRPVIATPVGILRDRTANFAAAEMVPKRDEYALAQAMLRLMREPKRRTALAQHATQEVQQYTWPVIAEAAERIYRGNYERLRGE